MSPTATLDAAVALEEEFIVPVELGITDHEMQLGYHRCCGCYSGACGLSGGDCRTEE